MPSTGSIAAVVVALIVGLVLGLALSADVDTAPAPPTTTTTPVDFPTRDSVGVPDGVVLQALTDTVVDVDGTVIDGALIDGGLIVRAADVTVTNSRIRGDRRLVVECDGCTNLIISDSEIIGTGDNAQACIGRTDYTLRRSLVIGCIDGAKANGRVTIADSFIGDLRRVGSSHNDGVQSRGGDAIRLIGNTIVHDTGGQTSAAKLSADTAPLTNVEVVGNRLITSTCLALYVNVQGDDGRWPAPTGQVVGNVVSGHTCADWLRVTSGPELVVAGNTDPDGEPL